MPVVATHRVRPTDVLASDVWSHGGSMLCTKGTLLNEQIVQRLLHFGVEMVHIGHRGEEPIHLDENQAAEAEAAVEQRFQEVQGDKFLMRLKNAVLTTIMTGTDPVEGEEAAFQDEEVSDFSSRQDEIQAELERLVAREKELEEKIALERRFAVDREERLRRDAETKLSALQRDSDLRTNELERLGQELIEKRSFLEEILNAAGEQALLQALDEATSSPKKSSGLRCLELIEDTPGQETTAAESSLLNCLSVIEDTDQSAAVTSPGRQFYTLAMLPDDTSESVAEGGTPILKCLTVIEADEDKDVPTERSVGALGDSARTNPSEP